MANDLGRGCLRVRHGDDAFVDKQQQRDVTRFICGGFGQQEGISKSLPFPLVLQGPAVDLLAHPPSPPPVPPQSSLFALQMGFFQVLQ